jgi:hypothetical protein
MSRIKQLILVAITLAALAISTAAPTLAGKGGSPHTASCGYGAKAGGGSMQQDPFPGSASEDPPVFCKGRQ